MKRCKLKCKNIEYFLLPIFIYGSAKQHDDKREDDEQTLTELSSAHRRSQAKCQLVQTSYIKRIKLFLFGHIINILLTELGRSVWENLDLDRWYRPHCVRSVLATSVKILPYRPPARLIRTNKYSLLKHSNLRYFDGKLSKLSPSEAVLQTLFLLPVLTSLLPHLIYLT